MYHQTPKGAPNDRWDVPLHVFQDQIMALIDAGTEFIELSATHDPHLLSSGMHVALTFDDGHESNASAIEFLASKNIKPTAFIVAQWSQELNEYLSAKELADLSSICGFGAHGFTHIDLTSLDSQSLNDELVQSRLYLEDALSSPVNAMALPGGKGNSRVLQAAWDAGYTLVCNSVADINRRDGMSIKRLCVTSDGDPMIPLRWAKAGSAYWRAKRLRHAVTTVASQLLGERTYSALSSTIRSLNIR
jgi:peptidoglycan/xylan/chitin deacetylase (PgdA/CDA1 family)